MRNTVFASLSALFACGVACAAEQMKVGDGLIDGRNVQPYEFTWRQCALTDGKWVDAGELTEVLVVIGDSVLRHRQIGHPPDGVTATSTTYFDRRSLAPLRMEQDIVAADGSSLGHAERSLSADGYEGWVIRDEETRKVQGVVASTMLHGAVLGLPLATLQYREEPLRFSASMMNFDATYQVTASWAGKEELVHGGNRVEAWMIDVEWLHEATGDVYPPGPDASGGRYWIVSDPPDGFPYVPRYKTDTYAVEFVAGGCPGP